MEIKLNKQNYKSDKIKTYFKDRTKKFDRKYVHN